MKNIFQLTLVGLTLLGASALRGGTTYQDGDVLLIFRQTGQNDVEYDIGNISQFTNHPNGYAAAVTGWDPTVATGVFGSDLTGVSVIIASTTSLTNANRTSWLSSGNPTATISDVTPTIWQGNLWSVINAIGNRPKTYLPKETFPYSLDPGGVASYDYIASGGGQNEFDLPQLGGNVNFTVNRSSLDYSGFGPSSLTRLQNRLPPNWAASTLTPAAISPLSLGRRNRRLWGSHRLGMWPR